MRSFGFLIYWRRWGRGALAAAMLRVTAALVATAASLGLGTADSFGAQLALSEYDPVTAQPGLSQDDANGAQPRLTQSNAVGAQPRAQTAGPKAYVGLFKDNTVAVLDPLAGQVIKIIPVPAGPHGLVITPDGRHTYVSSDGDSKVSIIDTTADQVTDSIDVGASPHGLAITPDGSRVLVAGFGTDRVLAIDTATNQVVWQAPVLEPHNIAITADGRTAYTASQQPGATELVIIDAGSGAVAGMVPVDSAPRALTVSPDGADLIYTLAGVDAVQVMDLASLQLEAQIPVGASPHYPLSTPDGSLSMVVSQGPGTLELFDPETYTRTGVVQVGQMPNWIATTADGRTAYVTNEGSNDVTVVDLTTETVSATIPMGGGPRKIALQPPAGSTPMDISDTSATATDTLASPPSVASITISGFAFSPATVTVSPGQAITFTNADAVTHTTTSVAGAWDSGFIAPGGSYPLTLQQPGTYTYHCSIHPFMQGTVVVTS